MLLLRAQAERLFTRGPSDREMKKAKGKDCLSIIPTRTISPVRVVEPFNETDLPVDAPERRRLPLLLRRAWYGLNQAFRRRILHLRVTPDQFTVMRTLIEAEPKGLTQRQMAEMISSDPNTIASLLERMESSGLIERSKDTVDRRARRIQLLPHGRKTYKAARAVALDLQTDVLKSLPEADRERFLENLTAIADACNRAALKRRSDD
jgi:DNA-binding MarR family transcriptional regulator